MSIWKSNDTDAKMRQQFDALKTSEEREEWLFKEIEKTGAALKLAQLAMLIYFVAIGINQVIEIRF